MMKISVFVAGEQDNVSLSLALSRPELPTGEYGWRMLRADEKQHLRCQ